jgi:hypothetical protein
MECFELIFDSMDVEKGTGQQQHVAFDQNLPQDHAKLRITITAYYSTMFLQHSHLS